jgi:uncharacterized protein DUF5818
VKKFACLLWVVTCGVLVGMIPWNLRPTDALKAVVLSPQDPAPPGGTAKEDTKTFVGQIAQWQGEYVLFDTRTRVAYKLDDQKKARPYDGQKVKVKGTLDGQNNTIRISSIELA